MTERHAGARSWLAAGIGGVVVVGAVLALFRGPREGKVSSTLPLGREHSDAGPPLPVGLVPWAEGAADKLLKEEALLRDPTPLFLPTVWNAAEASLPADLQREPGSQFRSYPARMQFSETELKLDIPTSTPLARPAEGLALDKPQRPFGGFGETDATVPALAPRDGYVEISVAGDGRLFLAESLQGARPPGDGAWQPLEFVVTVDAMGLVSPPVLTQSSRVASVDDFFQEYLGNGFHIGERLPPGFYRVAIGP